MPIKIWGPLSTKRYVQYFLSVAYHQSLQVDWDESMVAGRVCVRARISDELDQLKHSYNGIDSVLVSTASVSYFEPQLTAFQSKVAEQISLTVPQNYASTVNVVYFPQLGMYLS